MRPRNVLLIFAFLMTFVPISVQGQDLEVTKRAVLRESPSKTSGKLASLLVGELLNAADLNTTSGYYHVTTSEGEDGWVVQSAVRLVAPSPDELPSSTTASVSPADAIDSSWDKPAPKSKDETMAEGVCQAAGDGGDSDTNVRKNREDVPASYHDVSFDAIANLPYPKGEARSRASWPQPALSQLATYEGVALRAVGYIKAYRPQNKGNGESTNCHMHKLVDVDVHMALVGDFGQGEGDAVVVETTPRIRQHHPNWSNAKLQPLKDADTPVRISGWLMFDPEHADALGKYRGTLWEIHPITKIEILQNSGWVDLDKP
jgi:hypothetical protein